MGFLTLLFYLCVVCAATADTTVCNLVRPQEYEGRRISIRGAFGFTRHGGIIISASCPQRVDPIALLILSNSMDSKAIESLGGYFRVNGGVATACGVLSGQVVVKKHFRLRHSGGGPQGNGYGSRGAFRTGFVIQSVIEIHDCQQKERFPPEPGSTRMADRR